MLWSSAEYEGRGQGAKVGGTHKSNSTVRIMEVLILPCSDRFYCWFLDTFFWNFWIHIFDFKSFYWCARYQHAFTFNPSTLMEIGQLTPDDNGWHLNFYIINSFFNPCPYTQSFCLFVLSWVTFSSLNASVESELRIWLGELRIWLVDLKSTEHVSCNKRRSFVLFKLCLNKLNFRLFTDQ